MSWGRGVVDGGGGGREGHKHQEDAWNQRSNSNVLPIMAQLFESLSLLNKLQCEVQRKLRTLNLNSKPGGPSFVITALVAGDTLNCSATYFTHVKNGASSGTAMT